MTSLEPLAVKVTRFRCPSCGRTESNRSRARAHMARCWYDPENKSCKTCVHFDRGDYAEPEVGYPGSEDGCVKGVDLAGHPACPACNGFGFYQDGMDLGGPCPDCDNSPEVRDALKPGPIIHCDLWQERPDER